MIEKINTPIPLPVLNSSPKPLAKAPVAEKSKLKENTTCSGIPTLKPSAYCIIAPIMEVTAIPISKLPLTFHTTSAMVIIRPITEQEIHGRIVETVPRAIEVDSLETTIPAFLKPIKAIKRPIPPLIAFFKDMGMAFTIGGTQTGNSNQDKDDTGQEHGSQTSLPGKAQPNRRWYKRRKRSSPYRRPKRKDSWPGSSLRTYRLQRRCRWRSKQRSQECRLPPRFPGLRR